MVSTWSKPANTFIESELGFVYFFERMEAKNAVSVCFCKPHLRLLNYVQPTSKAFASAGGTPVLTCLTARENNCRFCNCKLLSKDRGVDIRFLTWRCRRSSELNSWRMLCRLFLFGLRRKNSVQKPSDLSCSSSSSYCRHIISLWKAIPWESLLWTRTDRAVQSLAGTPQVWFAEWGETAPYLIATSQTTCSKLSKLKRITVERVEVYITCDAS
jgi:hypothetical protein